ncbi:MAG: cytochrome c3 family protein, partial [Shewanella sp.]
MLKPVFILLLGFMLATPMAANAMNIKDYHKEVMTGADGKVDCAACHGDEKRKTVPDAARCSSCHGSPQDVANQTQRPADAGHSVEPNPH